MQRQVLVDDTPAVAVAERAAQGLDVCAQARERGGVRPFGETIEREAFEREAELHQFDEPLAPQRRNDGAPIGHDRRQALLRRV